jgi:hypothetical protein
MSAVTPVGGLAFLMDEETVLVRVADGWRFLQVRLCFFSFIYNFHA